MKVGYKINLYSAYRFAVRKTSARWVGYSVVIIWAWKSSSDYLQAGLSYAVSPQAAHRSIK